MKVVLSGPIKCASKSHSLWIDDDVMCAPIAFLRKPKWVTNNDVWEKFLRGVSVTVSAEVQAALNKMWESSVLDILERDVEDD